MKAPEFVVLMPAFHCEAYVERALRSVLDQEYSRFRVLFTEDHGADRTRGLALQLIQDHPHGHRVVYQTNVERAGPLANHVAMLARCDPDEIAVCVDADDQLAGPLVLSYLAALYTNPEVWCTYGSYEYDEESRNPNGDARGIARPIPPEQHTRGAGWRASHLKTFKVWLFRQIADDDLKLLGDYFDVAGDVALMTPMIEMAGPEHARYIERVLYYYNGRNPMNEVKVRPRPARAAYDIISRRPIYRPLEARPS